MIDRYVKAVNERWEWMYEWHRDLYSMAWSNEPRSEYVKFWFQNKRLAVHIFIVTKILKRELF